jgi:phenylacetate-CoA ligase
MYSSIYRTARLFRRGGWETRQHLNELRRSQWLSKSELKRTQLAKIQHLTKYAYENIPYYRNLYKKINFHPQDLKTIEDFQSLPILTKQDVVNHLDEFVNPNFWNQVKKVETGASTGEPMKFYVEDSFWWWNVAYEQRGREWHGVHEGDKIAWVWGSQTDMYDWNWQARLKARFMRHQYLNAFNMTERNMKTFADKLIKWKPAMVRAYASMIYLFAQFLKKNNITNIRPKLIETTAEKLKTHQRQLIEETFQCVVADCYTAREFATIAYACEFGNLHVGESRYLELLDKGRVIEDDRAGEVVITSLHQFGMPFIRYKLDDEAYLNLEDCPCGRSLPVLKEILGRKNDYILTIDDQYVHDGFFAFFFWSKPEVVRYQIYQPDKKSLEVRLICDREINHTWLKTVEHELKEQLGKMMDIDIQVVRKIDLTKAGKHRFIISDVIKNQ